MSCHVIVPDQTRECLVKVVAERKLQVLLHIGVTFQEEG